MNEELLRKTVVIKEVVTTDAFGQACQEITRVVACAVLQNPCAGRYVDGLTALFDLGGRLGEVLSQEAVSMLSASAVSYGKGAIVGMGGDAEHGAAMIHPKLGKPLRAAVGGGAALIPSNVKVASPGASFDLPLGHKDEAWSFDHFDTMTITIADAPRPDEIVLVVGVADGGRPLARSGDKPIV